MGDAEDMRALREKFKAHGKGVTERRTAETRVPSYSSRRKQAAAGRTEQTNLKLSPQEKRRLIALAEAAGESMTQYVWQAIEMRAESGK